MPEKGERQINAYQYNVQDLFWETFLPCCFYFNSYSVISLCQDTLLNNGHLNGTPHELTNVVQKCSYTLSSTLEVQEQAKRGQKLENRKIEWNGRRQKSQNRDGWRQAHGKKAQEPEKDAQGFHFGGFHLEDFYFRKFHCRGTNKSNVIEDRGAIAEFCPHRMNAFA